MDIYFLERYQKLQFSYSINDLNHKSVLQLLVYLSESLMYQEHIILNCILLQNKKEIERTLETFLTLNLVKTC